VSLIKNKILVAKNEPDLLAILDVSLSTHFDVLLAENEVKVRKLIEPHGFLFLVLDIHLPDMSGIELCQCIIALSKAVKPDIAVVTGDNNQSTIIKAYYLKIEGHIIKSIYSLLFFQYVQRLEREFLGIFNLENQRKKFNNNAQTSVQKTSGYNGTLELISPLNKFGDSLFLAREWVTYLESKSYFSAVHLRSDQEMVSFGRDSLKCSEIELKTCIL
jgi:response regulator RpfG family c-di-GMP phosphodiesterase